MSRTFKKPDPHRHICLVGLQIGDEGKGKIVDSLCANNNIGAVVRFQGGPNAGHTVYIEGVKHVLHHIPIGALHDKALAILGNGMVIEPKEFLEEYDLLPKDAQQRVRISDRAHLIQPKHLERDAKQEDGKGGKKIGTTLRGIGPTYVDKYDRVGMRLGEIRDKEFNGSDKASTLFRRFKEAVGDKIVNTVPLLRELDNLGETILFEGAQGVLLDIDFGQYPFVTSSQCTFLGVGPGTGFSPRKIGRVVGVAKAYVTRVGAGAFPSAANKTDDQWMRDIGGEYGATTGRPRMCGWLDIPALKYAAQISDVDELAIVKLDVFNGCKEIPVCVGYTLNGELLGEYPSSNEILEQVEPVFESWPGWKDASSYEQVQSFIRRIEVSIGVPVTMVGYGKDRNDLMKIADVDEI